MPIAPSRLLACLAAAAAIVALGLVLPDRSADGRSISLSLWLGAAFGLTLQRARFCFFCVTRDWLDGGDGRGLLGIVVALAIGALGYAAIFGAWLPNPVAPRLPPTAHIGPVSPALALAAFVFGLGMAISGSCISAHLYRLGEGSGQAPLALLGALVGFGLGFLSWNFLFLRLIQEAPVIWLPHSLGYGGWLVLHLALLGAAALVLLRRPFAPQPAISSPLMGLLTRRWPAQVGGLLVALIGTLAYLRLGPLGVTAELGSVARTAADGAGLLPSRIEGLDALRGCMTVVKDALLSPNGAFVVGLVLASFAAAVLAGDFRPRLPTGQEAVRALVGGVLMGWGAMVALGCTVGVLLSGIMAGAASGWVFLVCCFAGVWLGWRGRQRLGMA